MVRLYLPEERPPQEHSLEQIASAKANGCSVSGYMWLYQNADPVEAARRAMSLAVIAGDISRIWIDWEPYTDRTAPPVSKVLACAQEIEWDGFKAGIYTGRWFAANQPGVDLLGDYPLWTADYSTAPASEPPLTPPLYGGWAEAAGHQWTSTPLDRNVFLSSVV